MDSERNTEKTCGARVEFQSLKELSLPDGKISSGQGILTCSYPNGACQLESKQRSGFMVCITQGTCKAHDSGA